MRAAAIVLAAGEGKRLGLKTPKPLVRVKSLPLFVWSLKALSRHPLISEIILVASASNRAALLKALKPYRIPKLARPVIGGKRRQDSVYNGLKHVAGRNDIVLIHDCARPFVQAALITALIKEAARSGAAIAGVPVRSTVKKAGSDLKVQNTVERRGLWEIQTPQVFRRKLLQEAFRACRRDVTDDAMLVESLGGKVKIVPGSYFNIKVTVPEDLVLAEAIARHMKK